MREKLDKIIELLEEILKELKSQSSYPYEIPNSTTNIDDNLKTWTDTAQSTTNDKIKIYSNWR
jgi:hypothetical protein